MIQEFHPRYPVFPVFLVFYPIIQSMISSISNVWSGDGDDDARDVNEKLRLVHVMMMFKYLLLMNCFGNTLSIRTKKKKINVVMKCNDGLDDKICS